VETRTSGSEGGGEQTTARKRGMAARLRPYIEIVRSTQRNVKRWRDGDMRKRWTAAGMLVAEQQFRRIIGYRDLAKLIIAIERRHAGQRAHTTTHTTPSTAAPEVAATTV
jgi:putative transposase